MKRSLLLAVAAAMALSGAAGAMAQPYDQNRDHGRYADQDNGRRDNGQPDQGRPDYGRHDNGRHEGWQNGRHEGWRSDWRPGARMDRDYWARGERVDWRERHLRRPPRGYEWRYMDGRYVLAAAATGLIASIIANSR